MKKTRKSNIELLRIIAILLIICFHYVYKSGYVFEELSYNSFIVKTFYLVGELGVNIFFLITGYFMVKGKFSWKKLIKLLIEVNFYYIVSLILVNVLKYGDTNIFSIVKNYIKSLPVIFNTYWFATVYVLLYILSPYLNIFIHSVKREDYKRLLLTLIIIWSVIPTIFGIFKNSSEGLLYFNRFIWAIIIYLIGAYMQLYSIKIFEKNSHSSALIAIISFAIMLVGIFVISSLQSLFKKIGTTEVAYFWRPNTLPMLLLSVSIFNIFLRIKMKSNKLINTLASTTFGVYLIHDGPMAFYIWNNIFKTKECLNSPYSFLYIIISAIAIFLIGALIDIFRQVIEKYTVDKLFETDLYKKLKDKLNKVTNKFIDNI